MSLAIEPEIGVPYSDKVGYLDLRVRAEAACKTATMLADYGLNIKPTNGDEDIAAKLSLSYADNPEAVSKEVTDARAAKLPPAALVLTHNILTQFGQSVVESATQVRHLVINKLIEETENPDSRVRIRALELLGKVADVGLFAERTEITITHQTTDELRNSLREKLARLANPHAPVKTDSDEIIVDGEIIDVDKELGIDE